LAASGESRVPVQSAKRGQFISQKGSYTASARSMKNSIERAGARQVENEHTRDGKEETTG
jgi:hypothetical protein